VQGFVDLFQNSESVERRALALREQDRRAFEQRLAEENARLRESEAALRSAMQQLQVVTEGMAGALKPAAPGRLPGVNSSCGCRRERGALRRKRQAAEAGFDHHVTKPVTAAALSALLSPPDSIKTHARPEA
jgi:hypothetical protein